MIFNRSGPYDIWPSLHGERGFGMEMNQIRYFLAVCEHRNFTHAARASNVSQPSLTMAIKKLEGELGGPLFLRDRAGCRLTPLGKLVRPRLTKVQEETREAKAEAIRHIRLDRVPISVGIGETIGHGRITAILARYRERLPQADIELIIDGRQALLGGLREGRFDIAITSGEMNADLYRIDPLYSEQYRVVVAADHPLGALATVPLERLAGTDLLDRPNCEMRDVLHGTCAERGHALYAAYRSNRVDWLLDLARRGAGAVVLPATAIPDDAGLVSRPLDGVGIERQVVAVRFRHQPSRPESDELMRELARG